ncbi:hypothetical protein MKQ68_14940 [Chitinophaga horti]|uniref:Uncharacterized protein n=1 Tax=Chitinophaga horti TaxID=2920382 RepID=A0ABY6IVJ1_9BACT|nr:hypothetical protein [Chitinophaga horti]UYQ91388.1 hypothetical protein MKQ68_14940 [Chitinophaga horti]
MLRITLILLLTLFSIITNANTDSTWKVLIYQQGREIVQRPDMSTFAKTGFYLYRHVVYGVTLKGPTYMRNAELIDVVPDTLRFVIHAPAGRYPDTVSVHYREVELLSLQPALQVSPQLLKFYDFRFVKDTGSNYIPGRAAYTWDKDGNRIEYEALPRLTRSGIDTSFVPHGISIREYSLTPDPSLRDTIYRKRNVFGFTPGKREEINGLSFGFWTRNRKNKKYKVRDSLVTRGVNIELQPLVLVGLFVWPYLSVDPDETDTFEKYVEEGQYKWESKIYGFNVSLLNGGPRRIYGINLSATITSADEIHGLTISPIVNWSYIQKGTAIALVNRAFKTRGFQLGLFNKSFDHRGLQIGLWNRNAKRGLPIINWQLKGVKEAE